MSNVKIPDELHPELQKGGDFNITITYLPSYLPNYINCKQLAFFIVDITNQPHLPSSVYHKPYQDYQQSPHLSKSKTSRAGLKYPPKGKEIQALAPNEIRITP